MNNKFRNEKILKENLPKFEEIETSKLNKKYYSVTVISSLIVFSILSTILGLAFNFLDFDTLLIDFIHKLLYNTVMREFACL